MSFYYEPKKIKTIYLDNIYDICWIKATKAKMYENNANAQKLLEISIDKIDELPRLTKKEITKSLILSKEWFPIYKKIKNKLRPPQPKTKDKDILLNPISHLELPPEQPPIIKRIWFHIKSYIESQSEYILFDTFIQQFHIVLDDIFARLREIKFIKEDKIFFPYMEFNKSNTWLFFLALKYAEDTDKQIYKLLKEKIVFLQSYRTYEKLLFAKSSSNNIYVLYLDDAIYSGEQMESTLKNLPLCIPNLHVFFGVPYISPIVKSNFEKILNIKLENTLYLKNIVKEDLSLHELFSTYDIFLYTENSKYKSLSNVFHGCDTVLSIFEHKVADSVSIGPWITSSSAIKININKDINSKYLCVFLCRLKPTYKCNNPEISKLLIKKYKQLTRPKIRLVLDFISKLNIKYFNIIEKINIKKSSLKSFNKKYNTAYIPIKSVLPEIISQRQTGHYKRLIPAKEDP
jgi:hypothetical protein